jgi:hypothetical protein
MCRHSEDVPDALHAALDLLLSALDDPDADRARVELLSFLLVELLLKVSDVLEESFVHRAGAGDGILDTSGAVRGVGLAVLLGSDGLLLRFAAASKGGRGLRRSS